MSDAPDTNECAGYPEPDEQGIIRQPDLPYDLSTSESPGAADFIERMKRLKDEGLFDLETYRVRGAARPTS